MEHPKQADPLEITSGSHNRHGTVNGSSSANGTAHSAEGTSQNGAVADDSGAIDPELGKLVELFTQRCQAGETVDVEDFVAEHPAWADTLRIVLPALLGLAGLEPAAGDPIGPALGERDDQGRRVFGDFHIVREIARGGMGIVYEAEQIPPGRRVALKILPPAAAMDPRALQRFQLEAQVAGWLQHPRIVPLYAVGMISDVPYYAMQYIEGGSLADLIAAMRGLLKSHDRAENPDGTAGTTAPIEDDPAHDGPDAAASGDGTSPTALALCLLSGTFPPPRGDSDGRRPQAGQAPASDKPGLTVHDSSIRSRTYLHTVARLCVQAAEALGYAHDQGIVHRDIKPANLLLDRRGDVWIADFGMADVQGNAGLTLTGDLPGTLRYMSPEQALGQRSLVDRRTDIYALGATLYELLSLRPVVPGSDKLEILRRIAEDEPESVRRLNPAVSRDLATIVTKSLAKAPSHRYETAWQLAEDLRRYLEGRPIAARPVNPLARTWRWCRRKPLLASLAASLVMAIAIGFAGITWNWRKAQASEQKALTQAAKAGAINRFLVDKLLRQAAPAHNPVASKVTLLEVLDRAAGEVGSSFTNQPEVEAAIRLAIAQTYHELGEYAKSETHLRRASAILEHQPGDVAESRLETLAELGHSLAHLNRLDEAEPLLLHAYQESRRILGKRHEISMTSAEYLAGFYRARGQLGECETLIRQVVDDSRHTRGPKHPKTLTELNNLALILDRQEKRAEAEQIFRECLELQREVLGPEHPGTLSAQSNLAFVITKLGRLDEADSLIRRTIDIQRRVLGAEHPATLDTISQLGGLLQKRGRLDEAEVLLRPCHAAQLRLLGKNHPFTVNTAKRLDALLKARARASAAVGRNP